VNNEAKLHLALMQTNNILSLIKGNKYEQFMSNQVITLQVELNRQLSLLTSTKNYHRIEE